MKAGVQLTSKSDFGLAVDEVELTLHVGFDVDIGSFDRIQHWPFEIGKVNIEEHFN